jgi:predicted metalloprotease with PDZ domain
MDLVRYAVAFPEPHTHLFEVEGTFPASAVAGGAATLTLPSWTPGSYLLREFARHVQDVHARDEHGTALAVTRVDKRTWSVQPPAGGGGFSVRWRVFARDLTVRTSYLDPELAFFNGANLFLVAEGLPRAPVELMIEAPAGRQVVCSLPRVPGSAGHTFRAADVDELFDAPVLVADCPVVRFEVLGKPHELAVWGGGNYDLARLEHDLSRLIRAEAALFEGLPYERYAFLLLLTDRGRGGLEHKSSCALLYPRHGFAPERSYEDFLQLAAHELFHLWNVKRIRPAALTPYDYGREQYTSLLWAFEGLTSYYDTLVPLRAGLYGEDRYLELLGERITDVERTPGRQVVSLAEASTCAWVKYYRPDENSPNSTVSYYVKGEVLGILLDLSIRRTTDGARSLDDVMRLLWRRHGQTGTGVPEDGVEAAIVEVGGESLRPLVRAWVHGTGELPYEDVLGAVGLTVHRRRREGEKDKGGTPPRDREAAARPWLGANVRPGDRPVVTSVLRGSPAELAGLTADDELVALGSEKLDGNWSAVLDQRRPGERVALHVFRRGQLRELTVVLAEKPADTVYLKRTDPAPELLRAYLAERWG